MNSPFYTSHSLKLPSCFCQKQSSISSVEVLYQTWLWLISSPLFSGTGWLPLVWASLNLYFLYIVLSYIGACVCICTYMCVHTYIYTFICMCIYIYKSCSEYWLRINHVWLMISSLRAQREHVIYINMTVDRLGVQVASINYFLLNSFFF